MAGTEQDLTNQLIKSMLGVPAAIEQANAQVESYIPAGTTFNNAEKLATDMAAPSQASPSVQALLAPLQTIQNLPAPSVTSGVAGAQRNAQIATQINTAAGQMAGNVANVIAPKAGALMDQLLSLSDQVGANSAALSQELAKVAKEESDLTNLLLKESGFVPERAKTARQDLMASEDLLNIAQDEERKLVGELNDPKTGFFKRFLLSSFVLPFKQADTAGATKIYQDSNARVSQLEQQAMVAPEVAKAFASGKADRLRELQAIQTGLETQIKSKGITGAALDNYTKLARDITKAIGDMAQPYADANQYTIQVQQLRNEAVRLGIMQAEAGRAAQRFSWEKEERDNQKAIETRLIGTAANMGVKVKNLQELKLLDPKIQASVIQQTMLSSDTIASSPADAFELVGNLRPEARASISPLINKIPQAAQKASQYLTLAARDPKTLSREEAAMQAQALAELGGSVPKNDKERAAALRSLVNKFMQASPDDIASPYRIPEAKIFAGEEGAKYVTNPTTRKVLASISTSPDLAAKFNRGTVFEQHEALSAQFEAAGVKDLNQQAALINEFFKQAIQYNNDKNGYRRIGMQPQAKLMGQNYSIVDPWYGPEEAVLNKRKPEVNDFLDPAVTRHTLSAIRLKQRKQERAQELKGTYSESGIFR